MNGEVKSYKLNDPMSWEEFKALPDDLKIAYVTALRKKYNVSDTNIAKMMGVCQVVISKEVRRLGISGGRRGSKTKWDADGWYAWVNGVPVEAKEDVAATLDDGAEMDVALEKCDEGVPFGAEECDTREDDVAAKHVFHFNAVDGGVVKVRKAAQPAIPGWGQMELEGTVEECAKTLEMLLADSRVKLAVSWTVVE